MVAVAIQNDIVKTIPKRKARDLDPAELYRLITNQMRGLEMATKRADYKALVLADLREGTPAYVVHSFKWNEEIIQSGTLWHPGMEFLGRFAQILESPEHGRHLITQAAANAGKKLKELSTVARELAPLLSTANGYKDEAKQNRDAQEKARLAEIMYRAVADQAEANFKSADEALRGYVSKLTLEI